MPDRMTLLDQASELRDVMLDQHTPWDMRMRAKTAMEKIDVAVGLLPALGRKMGSPAAAEALIDRLLNQEDQSPYPLSRGLHRSQAPASRRKPASADITISTQNTTFYCEALTNHLASPVWILASVH